MHVRCHDGDAEAPTPPSHLPSKTVQTKKNNTPKNIFLYWLWCVIVLLRLFQLKYLFRNKGSWAETTIKGLDWQNLDLVFSVRSNSYNLLQYLTDPV